MPHTGFPPVQQCDKLLFLLTSLYKHTELDGFVKSQLLLLSVILTADVLFSVVKAVRRERTAL